jgi:hypothetical protein
MFVRDTFFTGAISLLASADDEPQLLDPTPRLALHLHDHADPQPPVVFDHPTMRFGLSTNDPHAPGVAKRLTFDQFGRSNNTCVRLDGWESLLGERNGHWQELKAPLGKDAHGRERVGCRSVWVYDDQQVFITQLIEIVPGQTSRLLDTCLVRYRIENRDGRGHDVGLRFLLDTFIGANDGVPFTLPGSTELCDTMYDFSTPSAVPDFIQALEREDLAHPGTVANLQLRLGGKVEAPERVTLGAWPNSDLRKSWNTLQVRDYLRAERTLWDVPLLPMKLIQTVRPGADADSAVVMYWSERELAPGASR